MEQQQGMRRQQRSIDRNTQGVHSGWEEDEEGFRQQRSRRRWKERPQPIIGRSQRQKLRVVPVYRDIFVSRLHPETSVEEIVELVTEVCGGTAPADVQKLSSRYSRYSSFRVTCTAQHKELLMTEDAWEDGALVRPYFAKRNINRTDSAENQTDKCLFSSP